jgi:hypothetical protein
MSRKQGPHAFVGMRPAAIAAGRRKENSHCVAIVNEAAA